MALRFSTWRGRGFLCECESERVKQRVNLWPLTSTGHILKKLNNYIKSRTSVQNGWRQGQSTICDENGGTLEKKFDWLSHPWTWTRKQCLQSNILSRQSGNHHWMVIIVFFFIYVQRVNHEPIITSFEFLCLFFFLYYTWLVLKPHVWHRFQKSTRF